MHNKQSPKWAKIRPIWSPWTSLTSSFEMDHFLEQNKTNSGALRQTKGPGEKICI
jgi:hypothetical protein